MTNIVLPVPIINVESISHIQWSAKDGTSDPSKAEVRDQTDYLFETYSGNISLAWKTFQKGTINRVQFETFVPFSKNQIRAFKDGGNESNPEFEYTALVTPTGFAPEEDEASLCAVDEFSVSLVEKQLPNFNGKATVLVLKFSIGLLNGVLLRAGYTITVKSRLENSFRTIFLDDHIRP